MGLQVPAQAVQPTAGDRLPPEPPWQRLALLICCLVLAAAGITVKLAPGFEAGSREYLSGTFLKVSLVVGLAWLAAPQLERLGWERLRGTGLGILAGIGMLTAIRPRFGAIAIAVAIAGFVGLTVLGWVRGVIFNGAGKATIPRNNGKIEKNPTRR
jgi:hypothetical protein